MRRSLRALPGLLRVGFASALAYRAELVIWVLAYTMPLIMLALWTAVAAEAPVGRFREHDFAAYFLGTLMVRLATGAWVVWDLNYEVRQGTLQRRLLWPVHALVTFLAENLSALPMRFLLVVPIALASSWWLGISAWVVDPVQRWIVPFSLFGAFMMTFLAMAMIGTLSLFWESSIAVFDLWLALYTVLSGYVVPLELFPANLRPIVDVLPYRYMLAFPVENLIGSISRARALHELCYQWLYVLAFGVVALWLWRRGLKRFAAFGG
jgi:ABC-2 type transport system permease protein